MLPDYLTSAVRLFARENAVFFASASAFFLTTTVVLAGVWFRRHLVTGRAASVPSEMMPSDQLTQLGRAVDAIAIEVERIGEAQRYAAQGRLEAMPRSAERRPDRTPTPH